MFLCVVQELVDTTPTTETDERATVRDVNEFSDDTQNFGPFCASSSTTPSASYDLPIGGDCGGVEITNTATFTTNDSHTVDSDSVTVNDASGSGVGGVLCEPIREGQPPDI